MEIKPFFPASYFVSPLQISACPEGAGCAGPKGFQAARDQGYGSGSLSSCLLPNSAPASQSRAGGRGKGSTKPRGYTSSQRQRIPKGQRFQRARKPLAAVSVGSAPPPAAPLGNKVFQSKMRVSETNIKHTPAAPVSACPSLCPSAHPMLGERCSPGTGALATLKTLPASQQVTCKRGMLWEERSQPSHRERDSTPGG